MTRHLPAATLQRASRRTFVALCAVLALAAAFGPWLGLPRTAVALPEEDRARSFIEGLAADAVEALTTGQATHADKMQRFRSLLSDNFAVNDIGEWVLGRYWALATPEERTEYLELFEEMIVATYVRRFERYAGETLAVGRAFTSTGGGDILVDSQIVHPDGLEPVNVGWRVRAYDDGPKIVDVIVEGVSMGQTQRSEFGSVIRRNNGEISGLLSEMRRMVEDGR